MTKILIHPSIPQVNSVPTPPAGFVILYPKPNGAWFVKRDDGSEIEFRTETNANNGLSKDNDGTIILGGTTQKGVLIVSDGTPQDFQVGDISQEFGKFRVVASEVDLDAPSFRGGGIERLERNIPIRILDSSEFEQHTGYTSAVNETNPENHHFASWGRILQEIGASVLNLINDAGISSDTTWSSDQIAARFLSADSFTATKQDILVSGTNIKTINGQSILGGGDLPIGETETVADLATWAGKFDNNYKIYSEITEPLPLISNTNAVIGNTLEIYNYNSPSYPLQGQEAKLVKQTGQFDPLKTHRIVVEYIATDQVWLIIGQNDVFFIAPTFGVNPTLSSSTAYEGESISINAGTGGTAVSSEYVWEGLSQDDVWEIIVGESASSYVPPRSVNATTGFKNVRCIVYPLDSQNRRGAGITLTLTTFYKVENINRCIANFETGANINVRSNLAKTSNGTSTKGTVTVADTQGWLSSNVSPIYVLNESYRQLFEVRGKETGQATGATFGIKPNGTATFASAGTPNIVVNETDFTQFVGTYLVNSLSSGGTSCEFSIQNVLVDDFIEVKNLEIYKVLNP